MENGTVLLWKTHGIVGWAIKRVTGKPWGHEAQFLDGYTWERTIWWNKIWFKNGVRLTSGVLPCDEVWQLITPLTPQQNHKVVGYWLGELNNRRPYNIPKLLVKALVIPLRRFFDRLGWVPFDAPPLGDDCSTSVAEAFDAAGISILPGVPTGRTAPGDFRESPLLELATPPA